MDCERALRLMQKEASGQAAPDELEWLHAHLDGCEECEKLYEIYRDLDGAVASLAEEPPERLAEGVMYRIAPEYVEKRRGKRRRVFPFAGTAAAAAAAVLLLIGHGRLPSPDGGKSKEQAQIEVTAPSNEAMTEKSNFTFRTEDAPQAGEPMQGYAGAYDQWMPEASTLAQNVALLRTDHTPAALADAAPVQDAVQVEDLQGWLYAYENGGTADERAKESAEDDSEENYTVTVYLVTAGELAQMQEQYGDACVIVQYDAENVEWFNLVVAEPE